MSDVLTDTLEECLARLEAGASIDECLAAYPHEAADLEGPLRTAAALRQLPRPPMPVATRAALSSQVRAGVAARRVAPGATTAQRARGVPDLSALLAGVLRALGYRGPLAQPWLRLGSLALGVLLTVLLGVGAVAAARAVRAIVAPPPAATAPFAFTGPIEQMAATEWTVRGATITLGADTSISGVPAIGTVAQVQGELEEDGTLRARSISVELPPAPSIVASPSVAPAIVLTATPLLPTAASLPATAVPLPPTPQPASAPAPTAASPPETEVQQGEGGGNGNDKEKEKEKDKEKEKEKGKGKK